MSEPFIAEVRIFAGNFAPRGWAFCNGQLLPIAQYTALFSLVGVTYGGDGRATFALPNMQGRAPMHPGRGPGLSSRRLGETGGVEPVTLNELQMAQHNHNPEGINEPSDDNDPGAHYLGQAGSRFGGLYAANSSTPVAMQSGTLGNAGGGGAHNNVQPFLTMSFIIALQGTYPNRP